MKQTYNNLMASKGSVFFAKYHYLKFRTNFAQKQEKGDYESRPNLLNIMVIRVGLEPTTQWLKAICSTN